MFTTAIGRLGIPPLDWDSCLLITEEHKHIVRAQQLGMSTLQFGGGGSPPPAGTDFADWSEAPMLIAHKLNGSAPVPSNLAAAVRTHLAATHPQLEAVTVQRQPNQAATALSCPGPSPGAASRSGARRPGRGVRFLASDRLP